MAGMERFTQRARRALSLAHQEAQRARNNQIGPEHLLLGLMGEEGGVAGRVLHELGLTADRVRQTIRQVTVPASDFDPNRVELATETQKILEFSVDEARRLGHHYIGTEHILLGLVREEGVAVEVLRRLDITTEHIRRQTRRVLNESVAQSPRRTQVLILHGQDEETRKIVQKYVEGLGLTAEVLNDQASRGTTFNERFQSDIARIDFVVALLTPDDLVGSRSDPQNTKSRAGQNVIYQLGFFHGKLGRNRVCAVVKSDAQTEMELPSHFLGVVYIFLDAASAWKTQLAREMKAAGLSVDVENEP
jgi:predicted nucleotide-binding protein